MSTTLQVTCHLCKQPLRLQSEDVVPAIWREKFSAMNWAHNVCASRFHARQRAAEVTAKLLDRSKTWEKLCPLEFRQSLDFRKRGCKKQVHDKIMTWTYGPRGLFFSGPTRTCKTRFAWKLLEREHYSHGRTVAAISHSSARLTFSRLAKDDMGQLDRYVTHLSNVGLLLIDDLGKGYPTESSESALWNLVEFRISYGKPMLVTSNDDLTQLIARFSEERGRALLRRIEDHCEGIEFK